MAVRALAVQFSANVLIGLASIMFTLWMARHIGPASFAAYSFYFAFGSVAAIAVDGGYRTMLLREGAKLSDHLKNHADNLPGQASGHALVTTIIISLGISVFAPAVHWSGLLGALAYFYVFNLGQFVSGILKGQGAFGQEAAWLAAHRLSSIAIPAFALIVYGGQSPMVLLVLGALGLMLPAAFVLRRPGVKGLCRPRLSASVAIMALPFLLADLGAMLNLRMDVFMLTAQSAPPSHIGSYAAAARFYESILNIAGIPVAYFVFAIRRDEKRQQISDYLPILIGAMSFSAMIAIGIRFAAPFFLAPYLGPAYANVSRYLGILLWALCFQLPIYVLSAYCLARNRERMYAAILLAGTLLDIPASWVLVHYFEAAGAAGAAVLTQFSIAAVLFFMLLRESGSSAIRNRPDGSFISPE